MFKALSSIGSNKIYLENNLLPLQIFYHYRHEYEQKMTKNEKCILNKLWRKYENMIQQDEYLILKIGKDRYKMFQYENIDDNTKVKIILNSNQVGMYDISEFTSNEFIIVKKKNVFFGVYKPLSIIMCDGMNTTTVGKTVSFDKSKELIDIWMSVEQLRLTVEAFLKSVEMNHVLKM